MIMGCMWAALQDSRCVMVVRNSLLLGHVALLRHAPLDHAIYASLLYGLHSHVGAKGSSFPSPCCAARCVVGVLPRGSVPFCGARRLCVCCVFCGHVFVSRWRLAPCWGTPRAPRGTPRAPTRGASDCPGRGLQRVATLAGCSPRNTLQSRGRIAL